MYYDRNAFGVPVWYIAALAGVCLAVSGAWIAVAVLLWKLIFYVIGII